MKRFLITLAALAVAACASDQPKKPEAGKASLAEGEASPVGVIPTALLHDAQRNKDVDVSIEYPTRGGPFPLIILSHAYGGSNRGYESLVANWTSHGYVVIRPAHADAGAMRATPPRDVAERGEEPRSNRGRAAQAAQQPPPFRPNPAEEIWDKEREPQWRDRARDISFVIDSLPGLEERFPELKGKIDRAKIVVAGHSYGAFTAMLVGGMRAGGLNVADSRVSAILAMSPQGVASNRGLTAESWRDVKVPAMFMTGSRDFGAVETETPDWRKTAYENSPAGDKYFVFLPGARTATFTGMAPLMPDQQIVTGTPDLPTRDPRTGQMVSQGMSTVGRNNGSYISERALFNEIRSIAMTFFDAYLKSEAKAKERLTAGQLGGGVMVEKK